MAGQNFSLSYNVKSYPQSDIFWWKSKDGVDFQRYYSSNGGTNDEIHKLVTCDQELKEYVTKTKFEINYLKFPEDNLTLKCNASNDIGSASEVFYLQVYGNHKIR